MKLRRKKLFSLALAALMLAATAAACRREQTPAAAFKTYYEAALKRDTAGMKKTLSQGTLKYFAEMARAAHKTTDDGLRANAEAMPQQMPETRNETVIDDATTLEIRHAQAARWEIVEFVKEDGAWKLALDRTVNRKQG
ncbi:MAG TPA: hypothetical protein VF735_22745 [Pyrinomonadaceae bacterium]|jgi:uncharacterized protein (DUF1800 family)